MRIFVSSRIKELSWERKIAVETIHDSGHTPLYIETEPRDRKQAKDRMDKLIGRADGFLLMLYLSKGEPDPKLDPGKAIPRTPIEYEYQQFYDKHLNKQNHLILRKKTDKFVTVSNDLNAWFDNIKGETFPWGEFDTPEQLISLIKDWLMDRPPIDEEVFEKQRFIIQYTGPDYIGLIAKISEVLFSKYTLNIDYISHASRSNRSTIYISCSSLEETNIEEKFIEQLQEVLEDEVDKDLKLAIEDGRASEKVKSDGEEKKLNVKSEQSSEKPFKISIHEYPENPPDYQFYIELRTIDAPGQLNAVCNVLRDANYNIDEIVLKPTEKEHRRQTTISLWLSKKRYSFSWDGVLEKDGKKLIRFLKNEFDIDTDKEPVINKKNARTARIITVSFDKKLCELIIKNKIIEIKIDGKPTPRILEVKNENGKHMIYRRVENREDELMILESRIRRLVGVRSFYTRIIDYKERKEKEVNRYLASHTKV